MLPFSTAWDKIPISYQPMLKLTTHYGFHELFLNYLCVEILARRMMIRSHINIYRKRINISVTLVSESYVLLYYETKVYMLFINKICLNQAIYKPLKSEVNK